MAPDSKQASRSGQDNIDPVYAPLEREESNAAATATAAAEPPPPSPSPAPPVEVLQERVHERPSDGGGSPSQTAAAEAAAAAAADRKGKNIAAISPSSSSLSGSSGRSSPPTSPTVSVSGGEETRIDEVDSGRKVKVSWKKQLVEEVVAVPKLARPIDLRNVFDDMMQNALRDSEQQEAEEGKQTSWPNKDSSLWSKVKGGMKVLEGIRRQIGSNRNSTFRAPQVDETVIPMTDMIQYYERLAGQGKIFNLNEKELHCAYSGFRPVLGDGECFYRSFLFSYLEQVLDREDTHEEHRLLTAVKEVAILHTSLGWNSKFSKSCKAFKKLINKVKRWKSYSRWKHVPTTNSYRIGKLLKFFSSSNATKHIFVFLRLVPAIWICSHQEEYKQRVPDLTDVYTLRHWCFEEVIPAIDVKPVQMTALVTALGVPVQVVDLSQVLAKIDYTSQGGLNPEDDMPRCTCRPRHMLPPDHAVPCVTVLYVNHHYDIIYPHRRVDESFFKGHLPVEISASEGPNLISQYVSGRKRKQRSHSNQNFTFTRPPQVPEKDSLSMALLCEPVTSKHTKRGSNKSLTYAVSAMQGYSATMEDYHAVIQELRFCSRTSFFGVYDGHGGPSVAKFCSETLHQMLLLDEEFSDPCTAVKLAFLRTDFDLKKQICEREFFNNGGERPTGLVSVLLPCLKGPKQKSLFEGCTACVALIRDNQIIIGNAGDSRCIISRNGQAILLSTDHKPDHPSEKKRIKDAGCEVTVHAERGNIPLIGARLAVSRTIGDYMYKSNTSLSFENQAVIALPDTSSVTITKEVEFLAIASGIWECMSEQEVADFINRALYEWSSRSVDIGAICESLLDYCVLQPRSKKNMTIVLVCFKGSENAVVSSDGQAQEP